MDLSNTTSSFCGLSGLSGNWTLEAGRAFTLRAMQPGALCVVHGRLWVTFDDAALDSRVRAGDHFLSPGENLKLASGQTLVMESIADGAVGVVGAASFIWRPAHVSREADPAPARRAVEPGAAHAPVLQSRHEAIYCAR